MDISDDVIAMISDEGKTRDEVASWATADGKPYTGSFEALRSDASRPHSKWKPCEHYKRFVDVSGPASGVGMIVTHAAGSHMYIGYSQHRWAGYRRNTEYSYSWPFGTPGELNSGLPEFYVPGTGGEADSFVPLPVGYDLLVDKALKLFIPQIKADMSLVNSVFELKDIKSIVPSVKRAIGLVKRARELLAHKPTNARSAARKSRKAKQTLGDVVRLAADWKLQYAFNIMPLVSDLVSIYGAMSKAEKQLNDFLTRAGKPQRRHYAQPLHEYANTDELESSLPHHYVYSHDGYGVSLYFCRRYVYYEPTQFHAEIEFNFSYTQFQAEHARLLSLLDVLGVNLNPAIVWNAIPWSFVVDWVIGVSRWLDNFKVSNMEPQINITQFLTSVKRKRAILVRVQRFSSFPANGSPDSKLMPIVTETAYRRTNQLPSVASLTTSGLNSSEFTLGAALVLTRKRSKRPR